MQELVDLTKSPIDGVQQVGPVTDADLFKWQAILVGPSSSPFKGGNFKLDIEFSVDYPFKPPKIKFMTKIYHPNIDDDGSICVDILKNEIWKPSTKLVDVFTSLVTLLDHPNPDDPLQPSIAEIYKNDHAKFVKTAKEYVKKYC